MGTPRMQASFAGATTATQFRVQQPTGVGGWNVIGVGENMIYADTDTLLGLIAAALDSIYGAGVWTLSAATTGLITIATTGGNFDWQWQTATDLRDKTGFAGDAANQVSPWTAPAAHYGGFYPAEGLHSGVELYGGSASAHAAAAQSISGSHSASAHPRAVRPQRRLALLLQRTAAGAFTEIAAYRTFLDIVRDARQFSLWPDSDSVEKLLLHLVGPVRIPYGQRFGDREWRYFRVEWDVEDVTA